MSDSHSAHAVIRPLRLPKRRTEAFGWDCKPPHPDSPDEHKSSCVENGLSLGVVTPSDAIEAYTKDGQPLGHIVNAGDEIRQVYQPGDTVYLDDSALAAKLVKAGAIAPSGATNVERLIHDAWGKDVFDAESLVSGLIPEPEPAPVPEG